MSTATADVLNNLDTQPPAAAAATTANNDNDFTESETDQALALSENPTDDTKNPYLYTPEESATIAKIRAEMEKHYPPGRTKTWPSSKALADDINKNVGDRFGFRVSCSSSSVGCTRRAASLGYENFQRKRGAELQEYQRRNRNSNRCGCLFLARTGDAFGRKSRKSQDKAIYITSASYMHTNGCRPCAQQLLNQNISGGKYTAADSMRDGLQTLMDMMKYKEYLESKTIRYVLKEKLPASVPTTAALIANVRVRLKKMLFSLEQEQDDKQRKRNNQLKLTTEESNKLIDAAQLDANNGVLCNDELDSPEYMQIATKQLKAMLRESLSQHGDELQQIVTLLQKAYAEDDGFDYRIGRDTLGNVTAIVWQDGIMRGHCTRLLDVVMLDMMKRQQNSIDWPYCGPVLITGENKIATACEAIIVTESIDAYAFVMNATYEMSGVDRSVTKCIFADGIMSISLLKKLGIEDSCSLILDKYHLIEVDWPKVFKWHYPNIKTLLKSMVESYTEDDFMERFEDVRSKCPDQIHQEYLEKEVFANRKHFVYYWTKNYAGHLNRLGDSGSESNHSSYCQRISFGAMVHPAEQLAQCLERSKDMAKELAALRYQHYLQAMKLAADINTKSNKTKADDQQVQALTQLSPEGFRQWEECNTDLPNYSIFDQEGSDLKLVLRHVDQTKPPRVVGPNHPCLECARSKATMSLCVHELLHDDGKFIIGRFCPRFHMLQSIEHVKRVSLEGTLEGMEQLDVESHEGMEQLDVESEGIVPALSDESPILKDGLEGEVNTVAVMPSVAPPLPSDVGQVDGIPSAASLPQPTKKKSYVDMMRYLESFAKLVANHPNQDACIGAVEGLKSIISGEAYADNLTLEQRFQNHLNQFNASRNKNLFGGSSSLVQSTDLFGDSFQSSSSLATSTSFSMVPKKSGSKIPHKAAKKRRKPALERRHDKLAGKSQALHLPGRTNTKKRCCHFCQDTEEHGSKSSCAKYNALRTHLVEKKGPLKSTLMQQLGDSSLHLLLPCPPTIEQNIKQRENSDKPVQPWPIDAAHMVLESAYFDCDAPFTQTRFAQDPRVTNSANNIIGVQFLSRYGADPITNSKTGNVIFYYRAREVRDIIHSKISGEKLLFDCIKRSS